MAVVPALTSALERIGRGRSSLNARLLAGFGLTSLLSFVFAIGSLAIIEFVAFQTTVEAARAWSVATDVQALRTALLRQSEAMQGALLTPNEAEAARFFDETRRYQERYRATMERLRALANDAAAEGLLDRIDEQQATVVRLAGELERARAEGTSPDLERLAASRTANEEALAAIDAYATFEEQRLFNHMTRTRQRMHTVLAVAAGVATIAAVAGLLIGAAVTRHVSSRVRQVANAARRITAFDFSTRLPPLGDDEVGQLAATLNQMADSLTEGRARLEAIAARLATINEAAAAVNSTLQLDELVGAILDQLARVVDVEKAAVFLDEGEGPRRLASRRWTAADDWRFGGLVAGAPTAGERSFLALPAPSGGRQVGALATTDRRFVAQPLIVREQQVGVLAIAAPPAAPFDDDDCLAIALFGAHVAAAIHNARLYEASKQIGVTEERNRLAREIHDTLAQGLTAISLQLDAADAHLEAVRGESARRARHHLARARELARANLDEARRSVLDLRAAPLEGLDLPTALKRLAQSVAQDHGIAVQCETEGIAGRYPARVEAGLYRIAQEAVANAVRHGRPRSILLRLEAIGPDLQLTIADNGQGFDAGAEQPASPRGGFGLTGMRERAALLGGVCTIESRPLDGTRVTVIVPSGLRHLDRSLAERSA
jgi:two-component system NarL family sensor kinase